MPSRTIEPSQPLAHAPLARRAEAGCWPLAAGRAMSLVPHEPRVLHIRHGRVWLTGSGACEDHVLSVGEQLMLAPGQHYVMEAWGPAGAEPEAVLFLLERPAPCAAPLSRRSMTLDWECRVVQPLRELGSALARGGRAVGAAWADVLAAGGRLVLGVAQFAWGCLAAPGQRQAGRRSPLIL